MNLHARAAVLPRSDTPRREISAFLDGFSKLSAAQQVTALDVIVSRSPVEAWNVASLYVQTIVESGEDSS